MKMFFITLAVLVGLLLIAAVVRFANDSIAPLFLNSRVERLGEKDLPKILIQGSTIYCRMKADDFRFPLPPGSRGTNAIVTGGIFDTIDGTVEAQFDGTNMVTVSQYEAFLTGKVQMGGRVTAETMLKGLLIKFHYFGDR